MNASDRTAGSTRAGRLVTFALAALAPLFTLAACDDVEDAGDKIRDVGEDIGDGIRDIGEDIIDEVEDVGN